jgi:D-glycero-beta-D-manno-heptose 1-phosphate adenylyltransferase
MKSKTYTLEKLLEILDAHREAGDRIVFTNGCFDILHAGHVRYLAEARAQGDILVIGLNADKSVASIKEEGRPIIHEEQRAEVLSGLWCVDYVILFDEPDPLALIKTLKPNILVKGADWPEDKIIGADIVKAGGGRVVRIPFTVDISTSRIIGRIAARFGTGNKSK